MSNTRQAFVRAMLADRVAARFASGHEDVSVKTVHYADGSTYQYGTFKDGDSYGVEVKTPKGIYTCKKAFDDKSKADKYIAKFADKANGHELLADVLGKDYKRVGAHKNAGEFTPAEWEAYKKEHPGANRADHTVTKGDKPKSKAKDDEEYVPPAKRLSDQDYDKLHKELHEEMPSDHPDRPKKVKEYQDEGDARIQDKYKKRDEKKTAKEAFALALMVERVAGEFSPEE